MTRWKKALLAGTTVAAMLVVTAVAASATAGGRAALRAAGSHAVLVAATTPGNPQPNGGGGPASSPSIGPIQVTIGDRWTIQGQLLAKGTVTITCGPFLNGASEFSSAQVTVEEALNDKVGHAQANVQSLTCDGAKHVYAVTALVGDVPFRQADGAVSVNANACGVDPSTFGGVCQTGSALSTITVR